MWVLLEENFELEFPWYIFHIFFLILRGASGVCSSQRCLQVASVKSQVSLKSLKASLK